jgi:hypothetical protein
MGFCSRRAKKRKKKGSGPAIGQAYQTCLTQEEQKALDVGCALLIDQVFEDLKGIEGPEDLVETTLELHLPGRYLLRYTPLFCKQFLVCILTVVWKLAQPERWPLSCVAEELAAWAIINQARVPLELEADQVTANEAFEGLIQELFEDLDFRWLFDDAFDGIDETTLGRMMGIESLKFEAWFFPKSPEPSYRVHPYVVEG